MASLLRGIHPVKLCFFNWAGSKVSAFPLAARSQIASHAHHACPRYPVSA